MVVHQQQCCPREGFSPHSVGEGKRTCMILNAVVEPNASVGKEEAWACTLKLCTASGKGSSTASL